MLLNIVWNVAFEQTKFLQYNMWHEKVASLSFIFISLSAIWKQFSIINWINDRILEYFVIYLNFP